MAYQLSPLDDYFHRRPLDEPFWNESGYFPFHNVDRSLSGFFYVNHRPNMNFTLAGLVLWDPSGEHLHDILHFDWWRFSPLGESTNTEMFDFSAPNGVTLRTIEPFKTFALEYDNDEITANLCWQSTMDPFNAPFPDGAEEWGSYHYEQGGRVTGTVHVNGEIITIDCGSNRDRSWGPRHYQNNPRGDFPWFNDGHGTAMHMYVATDRSTDDDPVLGTIEHPLFGWHQRDGKVAGIVSGARQVLERRPDGAVLRLKIEGEDELGRTVHAVGTTKNCMWWTDARFVQTWELCEWELDTGQKIFGEAIEWFPSAQGRRFFRSFRER